MRNKQQSCSSTPSGWCCKDWEDKIIVGSVLSALWWCSDSSGLISADPRPGLTDHILPCPSQDTDNLPLLRNNGRGVLDPTLWSLRPRARASAQVINLAKWSYSLLSNTSPISKMRRAPTYKIQMMNKLDIICSTEQPRALLIYGLWANKWHFPFNPCTESGSSHYQATIHTKLSWQGYFPKDY